MRYAVARYNQEQREMAYRIYVTDTLQLLGEGKYRVDRFADKLVTAEDRSAEDIIAEVLKKAEIHLVV